MEPLILQKGRGGANLIWAVHQQNPEEAEHMRNLIARYAPGCAFTLRLLPCQDWGADYSPWAAEGFAGRGEETLRALQARIRQELPEGAPVFIGGYSLAGLFALWAFYETDLFSGAAACSASLWFPGWDAYRDSHPARRQGHIYLSLGEKEERTRHPLMCQVGQAMRGQIQTMKQDPQILSCTLAMHPGGHGSQADVRMAQGFAWLLREYSKKSTE